MLNKWLRIILDKHQLQKSSDYQTYLTWCGYMAVDFAKGHNKEKLSDISCKLLIEFHLDILLE